MNEISASAVESLDGRLRKEAEEGGYHLNPDEEFTKALVRGLLINEERYGYPACPCRLASGLKEEDLDIICPCDYRDADVNEWGMCYCALYVSGEVSEGKRELEGSIDERRPSEEERGKTLRSGRGLQAEPLWRCRVCGYLCARDDAPGVCPVCRAKKDRFEPFPLGRQCRPEPLWRCRVCGYLCARSDPPETCPICRAKKDRFEPFL